MSELENNLMRVTAERDKALAQVDSMNRKAVMYGANRIPLSLLRFIDRLVEERTEFEYYSTLYQTLLGQYMRTYGKKFKVPPYEKTKKNV